jgi:oligoribonuclease (3'-5' exoribonuclease)
LETKEEQTQQVGEVCPDANKNPVCPYITAIHQNTAQVNRIEKALVGEDLQSGLVAKVHQLEVTQKILIALGSASLLGLVSLAIILIEKLLVK